MNACRGAEEPGILQAGMEVYMEKDQIIEIRIEDMLDDGRGFGRTAEGIAVFVSGGGMMRTESGEEVRAAGCVPGDLVRARVTRLKKNTAEAALMEISEASPDRIAAGCPYAGECGGCTMQELAYDAQVRLKSRQISDKLVRIGGISNPCIREMMRAENLCFYRNKAVFAVGTGGEVGFRGRRSHFVIDIRDCMLQSDAAMVCAEALREYLKRTGAGCIREMTVRTAQGTGEVMVILDLGEPDAEIRSQGRNGRKNAWSSRREAGAGRRSENRIGFDSLPDPELLAELLDDAVASLSGGYEEAGEGGVRMSLESIALTCGGKCRILAGKPAIMETFMIGTGEDAAEVSYEISPQSFFQVNPEQMVKLYNKAAEYAGLTEEADKPEGKGDGSDAPHVTVLDLYCGAGTIGIWLLQKLRQTDPKLFERTRVIGIESVKPAVIDANRNSVINGLINTRYVCGRAEEELPGMMGLAKLYKWNEVNERVEREPEIRIAAGTDGPAGIGEGIRGANNKPAGIGEGVRGANNMMAESAGNSGAGRPGMRNQVIDGRAPRMLVERIDTVILDPPRAGCGEPLLAAVAAAQPGRIVYVSCDPGTLARDIRYLTEHGFQFIEATPCDQFPWTSHSEIIAILMCDSKRKPDAQAHIDADLKS